MGIWIFSELLPLLPLLITPQMPEVAVACGDANPQPSRAALSRQITQVWVMGHRSQGVEGASLSPALTDSLLKSFMAGTLLS